MLPLESGRTMPFVANDHDMKAINTIRTLALDTVNKANSGHPGAPMGMAPVSHVLFSQFSVHLPPIVAI